MLLSPFLSCFISSAFSFWAPLSSVFGQYSYDLIFLWIMDHLPCGRVFFLLRLRYVITGCPSLIPIWALIKKSESSTLLTLSFWIPIVILTVPQSLPPSCLWTFDSCWQQAIPLLAQIIYLGYQNDTISPADLGTKP